MKVAVSYDKAGEITLMFDPSKMQGNKCTIGYAPAAGENHQELDLPKQFEGKPLTEVAPHLHVQVTGGTPKLAAKG